MSAKIVLTLILASCSMMVEPTKPHAPKEFSPGEVILSTQLLMKIFDQEMAPISCVPDTDEASLLLRTINPRMEVVQDDIEALLDDDVQVKRLIDSCDQNCTCSYLDDLLREHLVVLDKSLRDKLHHQQRKKDLNRCLSYLQSTFCESEIFKELDKEKVNFSFDE